MDTQSTDLPEPLEHYCTLLDVAFHRSEQKKAFRIYLQGLLLGAERNKTATYIANTEPGKPGSKHKAAQQIQWFLSESSWLPEDLHQARLAVMRNLDGLQNDGPAVLIIDETGDRKYGTHTAHVGRQYLGSIGKVDSGVVSVHLLYAKGGRYFPLDLVPYTPASHFKKGDRDPAFKSKPQLALQLIDQYQDQWPFRAVVADSFYGRNLTLTHRLIDRKIPFVLALPASYSWWHFPEEIGGVEEQAHKTPTESWLPLVKTFADDYEEHLWVAETQGSAFGPQKTLRLVVTTDPVKLPAATTEYLISNLRVAEDDTHEAHVQSAPATCQEVALLYARRVVIEQAYREVKQHLGWAEYQVRSSVAIQRHWALVCGLLFSVVRKTAHRHR